MKSLRAAQAKPRDRRPEVHQIVRNWVATERGTAVTRLRVTRSNYASSATLLNVHLWLADGETLRVVCKLGGPAAQIHAARGVKPATIYDAARETWMYRSVLALGAVDAPELLSSGRFVDGGQWLLIEWAGSVDLGQVGAPAVWSEAAARLARMHAWGESRLDDLSHGSPVRWDDRLLHLRWARRASRALAWNGPPAGVMRDPLAPLWRRYRLVADRLAALPKTLVHGDLNASNVLVSRDPGGRRIRIIDWETAGIGPGLIDLASLISGHLPESYRTEMVAAYRANLGGSRLGAMATEEFETALCWCRLALAVQWLGWSPGWSPPQAHAHDWRGEALSLARRLGLLDRGR